MPRAVPIALLMWPDSDYCRGVMRGIKSYADQGDCWIFGTVRSTQDLPAIIEKHQPAGVLTLIFEMPAQLKSATTPIVSFGNIDASMSLPTVDVDDLAVGQLAATYFMERGFKQLAFVGCPQRHYVRLREKGFSDAVNAAGLEYRSYHDPEFPDTSRVWTWTTDPALHQWLTHLPRPTGLFAANDAVGVRLIENCRRLELRVPEDVAIIGVDDDDLYCQMARPTLSSIKQPLERIGYEAARLLDRLMSGKKPPRKPRLFPPVGVVTRQSSDILAISDAEVAGMIRYLHDNAHRPISIKQALQEMPMSRRSLERKFRQTLGRSPLAELLRVRLRSAQNLLSSTDLPMSTIAEQTGFGSGKQFSTMFHKHLGTTPSVYRRNYQLRH